MKSPPISRLSGCIAAALVLCLVAGVCAGPGWTPPPYRPPPTPYWTPYRPQPTPYRTPYRAPTPYRTPYRAPTPYRTPYRAPTPYRTPSTPYRPSPTPYRNPTISGKQATPTRTPFQANKSTSAARPNNRASTVKWASGNAPKVRRDFKNAAMNVPPARRQQLQKELAAFKKRLGKLKAGQPAKSPTPALAAKLERSGETGNKPSSTNKRSTVKWVNGNAPKVRQNIRNAASNITAARRQRLQNQLAALKQRLANKLKSARSKPLSSKPRNSPAPASNSKVGQIAQRLSAPSAEISTPPIPANKTATSHSFVGGQGPGKSNLKDEVLGDTARNHSLAREFEKATKLTHREQDQIKETLSTLPPQLPNPRPKPPKFGQSSEAPWDKTPTSHRAVEVPPEKKARLREQVLNRDLNTHSLAAEFKKVQGEMVQTKRNGTSEQQARIREALSTPSGIRGPPSNTGEAANTVGRASDDLFVIGRQVDTAVSYVL